MTDPSALLHLLRLPLWVLLLAYITWGLFLAAMSLIGARAQGKLPRAALILGYPLVLFGVLCDVALQLVATAIFLDWPREPVLTQRCSRYIAGPDGWRKTVALWICRSLLDPFQAGGHCRGSMPPLPKIGD